jgi:hypothetical protein
MKLSTLPTLVLAIFTTEAFAAPAPQDSINSTVSEFTGDFFDGAVPTSGPGLATGPLVTPDGKVYDHTNMSLAVTAGIAGEPQQELRITMGTER